MSKLMRHTMALCHAPFNAPRHVPYLRRVALAQISCVIFFPSLLHMQMAVITKHGGANALVDLEEILEQVDKNADGKIDYEEFSHMMYASTLNTTEEENIGSTVLNVVKHGKSGGRRAAGACRKIGSSEGL
ncbi:hypothetical protein DUNSADRAFT_5916 [Dunaliella salina]|uniref:EF-hand domain-containing protein n=1 Tax=Dunaliella salina TaxID=3046 RepID=A0ABQ7GPD8_DUNSA|nr:hypothetical protein DUNSADRAFT_5916 [Dunaliella salina]|eukprot:KAF5836469.1 hypothetical protein DUNSADRAFT_5916 [Dunaliella salina]